MANQGGDMRVRLQSAALELFRERGYDRTTAAEIAARAGVTERTFFRYFPDKREVLFDGQATLAEALTAAIADAPAGLLPLDTLTRAFRSLIPMLEGNRAYSKPRQDLIDGTPALHEREQAKIAILADVLAVALTSRGVEKLRATFAARIGMVAFVQAITAWLDDPRVALSDRIDRAFHELRAVLDASN